MKSDLYIYATNIYLMPLHEIEQHPFLNYFSTQSGSAISGHYRKLIIGSFPVYELTDTVFPDDRSDSRWSRPGISMPFFYGSETNQFWERLARTFGTADPQLQNTPALRKAAAIELLEKNGLLLTDIIYRTNRRFVYKGTVDDRSPADQALLNRNGAPDICARFLLNKKIVQWIRENQELRSVYFTAQKSTSGKNPGGWFHQLLKEEGLQFRLLTEMPNALKYEIDLDQPREITLFFLPTPSGKRSVAFTKDTQHPMFINYLRKNWSGYMQHVKDGYPKPVPTVAVQRERFIREWWTAFLVKGKADFDGTQVIEAI